MESLEDRLAPSADLATASTATSLSLASANIVPNLTSATAQVTLTAQVSNPSGVVGEGVVSFTLAGVSGQGNVVNGTASVQLTIPLQDVTNRINGVGAINIALSYSDSTSSANFANSSAATSLSTNVWNTMLPTNLTVDSNGNEQLQVSLASASLLGFSYSSTGQLTGVDLASIGLPVTYTPIGTDVVSSIAGVPWGITFGNSNDQYLGYAGLVLIDGTPEWLVYDSNNQLIGEVPG